MGPFLVVVGALVVASSSSLALLVGLAVPFGVVVGAGASEDAGSGSALTTRESISGRNLGHSPEADAIGDKERNATASWPTDSDVLILLVVVVWW